MRRASSAKPVSSLHGGIALTDDYSAGHYFKRLTMIERLFGDDVTESTRRFALMAA